MPFARRFLSLHAERRDGGGCRSVNHPNGTGALRRMLGRIVIRSDRKPRRHRRAAARRVLLRNVRKLMGQQPAPALTAGRKFVAGKNHVMPRSVSAGIDGARRSIRFAVMVDSYVMESRAKLISD